MVLGFKDANGNSKWRPVSGCSWHILLHTSRPESIGCPAATTMPILLLTHSKTHTKFSVCIHSHRDCTQVKNRLTLHQTGECTERSCVTRNKADRQFIPKRVLVETCFWDAHPDFLFFNHLSSISL